RSDALSDVLREREALDREVLERSASRRSSRRFLHLRLRRHLPIATTATPSSNASTKSARSSSTSSPRLGSGDVRAAPPGSELSTQPLAAPEGKSRGSTAPLSTQPPNHPNR